MRHFLFILEGKNRLELLGIGTEMGTLQCGPQSAACVLVTVFMESDCT